MCATRSKSVFFPTACFFYEQCGICMKREGSKKHVYIFFAKNEFWCVRELENVGVFFFLQISDDVAKPALDSGHCSAKAGSMDCCQPLCFIFLFYSPPKKINTKKESTWPEKNILIVWTQERCTYMKKKRILVSYEVRSSKDNSLLIGKLSYLKLP